MGMAHVEQFVDVGIPRDEGPMERAFYRKNELPSITAEVLPISSETFTTRVWDGSHKPGSLEVMIDSRGCPWYFARLASKDSDGCEYILASGEQARWPRSYEDLICAVANARFGGIEVPIRIGGFDYIKLDNADDAAELGYADDVEGYAKICLDSWGAGQLAQSISKRLVGLNDQVDHRKIYDCLVGLKAEGQNGAGEEVELKDVWVVDQPKIEVKFGPDKKEGNVYPPYTPIKYAKITYYDSEGKPEVHSIVGVEDDVELFKENRWNETEDPLKLYSALIALTNGGQPHKSIGALALPDQDLILEFSGFRRGGPSRADFEAYVQESMTKQGISYLTRDQVREYVNKFAHEKERVRVADILGKMVDADAVGKFFGTPEQVAEVKIHFERELFAKDDWVPLLSREIREPEEFEGMRLLAIDNGLIFGVEPGILSEKPMYVVFRPDEHGGVDIVLSEERNLESLRPLNEAEKYLLIHNALGAMLNSGYKRKKVEYCAQHGVPRPEAGTPVWQTAQGPQNVNKYIVSTLLPPRKGSIKRDWEAWDIDMNVKSRTPEVLLDYTGKGLFAYEVAQNLAREYMINPDRVSANYLSEQDRAIRKARVDRTVRDINSAISQNGAGASEVGADVIADMWQLQEHGHVGGNGAQMAVTSIDYDEFNEITELGAKLKGMSGYPTGADLRILINDKGGVSTSGMLADSSQKKRFEATVGKALVTHEIENGLALNQLVACANISNGSATVAKKVQNIGADYVEFDGGIRANAAIWRNGDNVHRLVAMNESGSIVHKYNPEEHKLVKQTLLADGEWVEDAMPVNPVEAILLLEYLEDRDGMLDDKPVRQFEELLGNEPLLNINTAYFDSALGEIWDLLKGKSLPLINDRETNQSEFLVYATLAQALYPESRFARHSVLIPDASANGGFRTIRSIQGLREYYESTLEKV